MGSEIIPVGAHAWAIRCRYIPITTVLVTVSRKLFVSQISRLALAGFGYMEYPISYWPWYLPLLFFEDYSMLKSSLLGECCRRRPCAVLGGIDMLIRRMFSSRLQHHSNSLKHGATAVSQLLTWSFESVQLSATCVLWS